MASIKKIKGLAQSTCVVKNILLNVFGIYKQKLKD